MGQPMLSIAHYLGAGDMVGRFISWHVHFCGMKRLNPAWVTMRYDQGMHIVKKAAPAGPASGMMLRQDHPPGIVKQGMHTAVLEECDFLLTFRGFAGQLSILRCC